MIDGDMATQWGTYEVSWTDEEGMEGGFNGRWMNMLKKTSDGWKIHRDIWNFGPSGMGPDAQ